MRRLLLGTAVALCMMAPASADIINVGVNPTSATGHFSSDGIGSFTDFVTFQLIGAPAFFTFASATNDFGQPSDFITGFNAQLFSQVGAPGGGDDVPFGPVNFASPCPGDPGTCQILSGSATLDAGSYYLQIAGTGGTTAGYGGDITTRAIPGPLAGGGLPGILAGAMFLVGLARRRRRVA